MLILNQYTLIQVTELKLGSLHSQDDLSRARISPRGPLTLSSPPIEAPHVPAALRGGIKGQISFPSQASTEVDQFRSNDCLVMQSNLLEVCLVFNLWRDREALTYTLSGSSKWKGRWTVLHVLP